ncbi:unnamed protein product [Phytophthora fragariaefolia]|uniref:Unnamed protein product n=1 Tax=Phytophthora fragariaefolia TaxID=1490495 RepID=A0A9W6U0J8_9STRA|nr:unnamed protein product [Phytophthora fragariaefolia]
MASSSRLDALHAKTTSVKPSRRPTTLTLTTTATANFDNPPPLPSLGAFSTALDALLSPLPALDCGMKSTAGCTTGVLWVSSTVIVATSPAFPPTAKLPEDSVAIAIAAIHRATATASTKRCILHFDAIRSHRFAPPRVPGSSIPDTSEFQVPVFQTLALRNGRLVRNRLQKNKKPVKTDARNLPKSPGTPFSLFGAPVRLVLTMAAKFSMANTSGLFDSAAHVEASDRMQGAMEELKVKNERQEKMRAQQLEQQEREDKQRARRLEEALAAKAAQQKEDRSYVGQQQDELDSDDEAMLDELDEDPELERLATLATTLS